MSSRFLKSVKSTVKCNDLEQDECERKYRTNTCIWHKTSPKRIEYCRSWPGTLNKIYSRQSAIQEIDKMVETMRAQGISEDEIDRIVRNEVAQYRGQIRRVRPNKRAIFVPGPALDYMLAAAYPVEVSKTLPSSEDLSTQNVLSTFTKVPELLPKVSKTSSGAGQHVTPELSDDQYDELISELGSTSDIKACDRLSPQTRRILARRLALPDDRDDCKSIKNYLDSTLEQGKRYLDDVFTCTRDSPQKRNTYARYISKRYGRPIPANFYSETTNPRILCDAIRLIDAERISKDTLKQVEATMFPGIEPWWKSRSAK